MADGAMMLAHEARLAEARAKAYATPLDQFQAHAQIIGVGGHLLA